MLCEPREPSRKPFPLTDVLELPGEDHEKDRNQHESYDQRLRDLDSVELNHVAHIFADEQEEHSTKSDLSDANEEIAGVFHSLRHSFAPRALADCEAHLDGLGVVWTLREPVLVLDELCTSDQHVLSVDVDYRDEDRQDGSENDSSIHDRFSHGVAACPNISFKQVHQSFDVSHRRVILVQLFDRLERHFLFLRLRPYHLRVGSRWSFLRCHFIFLCCHFNQLFCHNSRFCLNVSNFFRNCAKVTVVKLY